MKNEPSILDNFIVLEGIDGSGTTTQLRLIEEKLQIEAIPHFCTFEPTEYSTGKTIRAILRGEEEVEAGTIAYLFSADRYEHLYNKYNGILYHLDKGKIVICDRYIFSSLAYQSVSCGFKFVNNVNKHFPLPAHLIFLDVSVDICQERLTSRDTLDIFETDSFQQKVETGYYKALQYYASTKMAIHKLNGAEPAGTIFQKIWKIITSLPILNK